MFGKGNLTYIEFEIDKSKAWIILLKLLEQLTDKFSDGSSKEIQLFANIRATVTGEHSNSEYF